MLASHQYVLAKYSVEHFDAVFDQFKLVKTTSDRLFTEVDHGVEWVTQHIISQDTNHHSIIIQIMLLHLQSIGSDNGCENSFGYRGQDSTKCCIRCVSFYINFLLQYWNAIWEPNDGRPHHFNRQIECTLQLPIARTYSRVKGFPRQQHQAISQVGISLRKVSERVE